LDRLEVRPVFPRYLSQDERLEIADLHRQGVSIRKIEHRLGRSLSTISRELRLNSSKRGTTRTYNPFEAQRQACARRARPRRRRIYADPVLYKAVGEMLAARWSPSQIARRLRRDHPGHRMMWVCAETIYQPSTSQDPRSADRTQRHRSTSVHYGPGAPAVELSAETDSGEHDSNNPCSPSMTALSSQEIGPFGVTGRGT